MRKIKSFDIFESENSGTSEVEKAARSKGYNIGPVYHGTNADFTVFDKKKASFYFRNDPMPFHFAFDEKMARQRGGTIDDTRKVLKCYLMGKADGTYDDDDNLIPPNADHVLIEGFMVTVRNPEQIKLADLVTYDDDGNPIPLSKRFDRKKKDMRY
jgi:hypothetical protein